MNSLSLLVLAALQAPPNPLRPLLASYAVAYSYGPPLIFAVIAFRLILPALKGGR